MIVKIMANVNIELEKIKRNGKTKNYKYGGKVECIVVHENEEIKGEIRLVKGTGAKYFMPKGWQYIGNGDDEKKMFFSEEQFKNFINDDNWIKDMIKPVPEIWKKKLKKYDIEIFEKTSENSINIDEKKNNGINMRDSSSNDLYKIEYLTNESESLSIKEIVEDVRKKWEKDLPQGFKDVDEFLEFLDTCKATRNAEFSQKSNKSILNTKEKKEIKNFKLEELDPKNQPDNINNYLKQEKQAVIDEREKKISNIKQIEIRK